MRLNAGAKKILETTKIFVETTKKWDQEKEDKFSAAAVRKALKERGLRAVRKKNLRLTPVHCRAQINWKIAHSERTINDPKILSELVRPKSTERTVIISSILG